MSTCASLSWILGVKFSQERECVLRTSPHYTSFFSTLYLQILAVQTQPNGVSARYPHIFHTNYSFYFGLGKRHLILLRIFCGRSRSSHASRTSSFFLRLITLTLVEAHFI